MRALSLAARLGYLLLRRRIAASSSSLWDSRSGRPQSWCREATGRPFGVLVVLGKLSQGGIDPEGVTLPPTAPTLSRAARRGAPAVSLGSSAGTRLPSAERRLSMHLGRVLVFAATTLVALAALAHAVDGMKLMALLSKLAGAGRWIGLFPGLLDEIGPRPR